MARTPVSQELKKLFRDLKEKVPRDRHGRAYPRLDHYLQFDFRTHTFYEDVVNHRKGRVLEFLHEHGVMRERQLQTWVPILVQPLENVDSPFVCLLADTSKPKLPIYEVAPGDTKPRLMFEFAAELLEELSGIKVLPPPAPKVPRSTPRKLQSFLKSLHEARVNHVPLNVPRGFPTSSSQSLEFSVYRSWEDPYGGSHPFKRFFIARDVYTKAQAEKRWVIWYEAVEDVVFPFDCVVVDGTSPRLPVFTVGHRNGSFEPQLLFDSLAELEAELL